MQQAPSLLTKEESTMAAKPSRDILIHCDACGEDYSSTYRRCPFCGAKNEPRRAPQGDAYDGSCNTTAPVPAPPPRRSSSEEPVDNYVFDGQDAFEEDLDDEEYYTPRPKGGKRLAPKQGGGLDLPPINWPRLITFLCSLVIIVAALVIVFTFIYPKLKGIKDPDSKNSAEVSSAPSLDPNAAQSQSVIQATDPVNVPSQQAPASLPPVEPSITSIVLKNSDGRQVNDITLPLGSSAQLTAEITPSGWTGPVTWASSNTDWITVSSTGLVTNVNQTGSYHNAYLTVTAGDVTVRCEVRVWSVTRGNNTQTPASQAPASNPPASEPPVVTQTPTTSGGSVTVGRTGTIVGADGGLRVRSGPGTTYEILASLSNGNTVTVVEDAGGGWYKITFAGRGQTMTGYIMGTYISGN